MLQIEGLSVSLGGRPVLDDVSFTVTVGEVVAVLGPSGCGKTTLLRTVAGLVEPSGGRVRLDGVDAVGVPPHRRRLGLMFQDHVLFPHLDVAGNVEFGLRMRGDTRAGRTARVAEVLALVRLDGFGPRAVSSLSGGERQRVALARSLAPAPDVLMLDEPLASLDRSLREELVVELRELFTTLQLAVVYVTHDQREALALADRLVVMREGRVAQAGMPREVWSAPADEWVARFLGLPNVVAVQIDASGVGQAAWGSVGRGLPGVPGTLRQVLIRSTAVSIEPMGSGPVDGSLAGTVRAVTYLGDQTQVRVVVGVDEGRVPVELEAAVQGLPPQPGARVAVFIDPVGVEVIGPASERAE